MGLRCRSGGDSGYAPGILDLRVQFRRPMLGGMGHYYLLGRSGLRVSRLALGTMNFGIAGFHAAYGKTEDEARAIFRRYLEAGGNFIDTADFYTAGESETILGELIAEPGCATGWCSPPSSPTASTPATRTRAATAAST